MDRGLAANEDRLAWIFGSSRSGSTWLLRMLSDLDGVVPIDDPHLGHHLGVWRPIPLAWAACEEPPPLRTLPEIKGGDPDYFFSEDHRDAWWGPLRDLVLARFDAQATGVSDSPGAFVVKEPGSHAAPLLTELFPASKVIFLLRDGRDVVDSWLDAYSDGSWAIPGGAFPVSAEGRIPLIRWLSAVWVYRSRAVKGAFERRPRTDRILIRYEDLRRDPGVWLERVCEVLRLDRAGAAEAVARHRFEDLPSDVRGSGCVTRQARPGGWQESLTAEEQEAMHRALGTALEEFGYEPETATLAVAS